ncbi:hypothetical protein BST85_04375 [Aureitalea marina]|uniref:Phytase-like domain-containing protein n=1 Tax=Aureitalea marina TaxID=930804 RepID=A0A2S7KTI2_9FLAO|nr:hypothetical protein BST85_04375 [Aureitalea marina]
MSRLGLICLVSALANCQDYGKLELVDQLPKDMREVSGIQFVSGTDHLWMVNDSGNRPEVYCWNLQESGLVGSAQLEGLKNVDWEELATNKESLLYVGDFGNNMNKRRDQVIYHLKVDPQNLEKMQLVGKTFFRFENQREYPPKKKERKFDVEAFIYRQGQFYLFTRHRDKAFDNGSNIYRIPATSGTKIARRLGKFESCKDSRDCQITAADYDPVLDRIALLSYNKVWILDSINWDTMKKYRSRLFRLGHRSQKESISFEKGDCLLIADERSRGQGPNLYRYCLETSADPEGNP